MAGVASTHKGASIKSYGDRTKYQEWEFVFQLPQTTLQTPNGAGPTGQTPGGETIEQVSARADRVIERAAAMEGDVALFGHGHMLRLLGACWLGLAPRLGFCQH